MRTGDSRAIAATAWALVLVAGACRGDDVRVGQAPLGWGGTTEANEVRLWMAESLESATRWRVAEEPVFELVPDSVVHQFTGMEQRYASEAVFLPDGRFVVLYSLSDLLDPDSLLLQILDPVSGEETRIPAPRGEGDQPLSWVHFSLALHDGDILLTGDNQPPLSRRQGQDVWRADGQGRFIRPPSHTDTSGSLLGVFPDGSLVLAGRSGSTDTTIVWSTMAVEPLEAGDDPSESDGGDVLFTTAVLRDPAITHAVSPMPFAHVPHRTTAVSGDTIWIVPTEKPELLAVHRSGRIVLKVEWEAGDRSIPEGVASAPEGLERFPAATDLGVGADGLIYLERVVVHEGRPRRGLEWLVFSPAGELVARLDVPERLASMAVLAFGDGALVARARDAETGLQEVRVYRFSKSS